MRNRSANCWVVNLRGIENMTCDKFATLISRDPKTYSVWEIGFIQKHYQECPHCYKLLGMDEHSMEWRFAWDKLDADAKKGVTRMIGCGLAVAICFLLGVFLRWYF